MNCDEICLLLWNLLVIGSMSHVHVLAYAQTMWNHC